MTTEKMTIHKGLAELKILDDRIIKEIQKGTYCAANKHSSEKINGISIESFKKKAQGTFDKITELINRRKAIKRAIMLSNAKTTVKISGVEYTVAEAIEMKNHGVELEKLFIAKMQEEYNDAMEDVLAENNQDLEKRADQYVTAIYGQKEGKTSTADIEKTRKTFIESNSYEIIDPINIPEKVEKLNEDVCNFMAEVDAALSVSNALTEITIEY